MKERIFILICLLLSIPYLAFAQVTETVKLTGFIKNDFIFDSRQNTSFREGHFLLYPMDEVLDLNGNDVNVKSSFNALSIQTRLNGKIVGPTALGAKTSGTIEGEFFGTSDADVNGFRLRHAFISLAWSTTTLLVGQTWHPMFVTEVFPQVVSFNTGAPFQPFSRNPQIRLTQSFDNLKVIVAFCTQRDFTSPGPAGFSSTYLRNSILPNTHLQLQYLSDSFVVGAGYDYKVLTPRIVTTKKYSTDETVSSSSILGYLKIKSGSFNFATEVVYGGNNADLLMLGGYAVKSINPINDIAKYIPINSFAIWSDVYCGSEIQPGIFFGYTRNLGADESYNGTQYSRTGNIDYIYRVSPRLQFNFEKFRIALETEITAAAYGTIDNFTKVINTRRITNIRGLVASYLFF